MYYSHAWSGPAVVVVKIDNRPVHTAQQVCQRCGTSRNAFTRELLRMTRGDLCLDADPVKPVSVRAALVRIRQQLDALEADGYDVDRDFSGRRRARPELPLAYKD
jgi:hypothetical protein